MRLAFRNQSFEQLPRSKMIQLIHVKAQELAMAEETRREFQVARVGKASCAAMSDRELRVVLQGMIAAIPQRRGRPGRDERLPDEPVTMEQLEKIEELFAAIEVQDSALRMQLCRRACRNPWAQTRAEGNKIVEMLKAMAARGWRPREDAGIAGEQS